MDVADKILSNALHVMISQFALLHVFHKLLPIKSLWRSPPQVKAHHIVHRDLQRFWYGSLQQLELCVKFAQTPCELDSRVKHWSQICFDYPPSLGWRR